MNEIIVVSILLLLPLQFLSGQDSPPQTVKQVDLQKYAGTWYEIAKIPNRFQKKCARNTVANYRLRSDGRIDVTNRCTEADGSVRQSKGIARVVDTLSNARLEVSFVRILGFSLFWGDYWIIGLAEDYRYAIVGTPTRKYGWILAREPKLSEPDREDIFAQLREQGYNPSQFEVTEQDH